MKRDELERMWSDPSNWRGSLYYCPRDPRLMVPKKVKIMGWTINAAHRSAWLTLVLLVVLAFVPTAVAAHYGALNVTLAVVFSLASICAVSAHLASKTD